jgi:hypothetical protein
MYEFLLHEATLVALLVPRFCYNQDTEALRRLREEYGLILLVETDAYVCFGVLSVEVRMPTVISFVLR